MAKVGIMTLPNSTSYGAILQMYASYRFLSKAGYDVEIINYQNHFMKSEKHTTAGKTAGINGSLLKRKVVHLRQYKNFRVFERKMIKYPAQTISCKMDLLKLSERYSHVICGSDQVWNPDITGNDMSYFLDFCQEGTKRISYAPSFGISDFPQMFLDQIYPELSKFHAISVREREGQDVLQTMLGKEIPLVLDPTFLLDRKDWENEECVHPAAKEPYVLYYTVKRSTELLSFAHELAKRRRKKLVIVGGNFLSNIKEKNHDVEYAWDISPEQWLYLMHHADCVVTNSFHGTAFSINYQKDFYLEFSSNTNSRLRQIIQTTGLEDRVVGENMANWKSSIDYEKVSIMLSAQRKMSEEYLLRAIQ